MPLSFLQALFSDNYEYVVCSTELSYAQHVNVANSWGGTIASVHSAAANTWITTKLTQYPGVADWDAYNVYLGAHRNLTENNEFVASDGTYPLDYTNWNSGEPNNYGGIEDALMIYSSGFWNDVTSSATYMALYNRPSQQIQVDIIGGNISSMLSPIISPNAPLGDICKEPSHIISNGGVLTMYGVQTISFSSSGLNPYLPNAPGSILVYLEFEWTFPAGYVAPLCLASSCTLASGSVCLSGVCQSIESDQTSGQVSMLIPSYTTDPLSFTGFWSGSTSIVNLSLRYECPGNSTLAFNNGVPQCICNSGYLSSTGFTVVLVGQQCLPALGLYLEAAATYMNMSVTAALKHPEMSYFIIEAYQTGSASTQYPLNPGNGVMLQATYPNYTFVNLIPGRRYDVSVKAFNSAGAEITYNSQLISNTTVTHYSCTDVLRSQAGEWTGMPQNFIITQDQGFVSFQFQAASRCEQGYAFTRQVGIMNGTGAQSVQKSAFTPNYYYLPKVRCDMNPVVTGRQAADDLSLSKLTVGQTYTYCVRAVNQE